MSFKPGRLGAVEGAALVFAVTLPAIYLTNPVRLLDTSAGLAWLVVLFNGVTAFLLFHLFLFVFREYNGDVLNVSAALFSSIGKWVIGLFYISVFSVNAVVLVRLFAESSLLTALPFSDISGVAISYTIVASILVYMGVEATARTSYIITPVSVCGLLLVLLLLIPYYKLQNLFPLQGTGVVNVSKTVLLNTGINIGVFSVLVIRPAFQNLKTVKSAALLGLGASVFVKTLAQLVYILVFGVAVGREKVLPFFELARLVYLSRFLQHIEALFILLWVMGGVLGIAVYMYLAIYLIVRLFQLPDYRPLVASLGVIMFELAMIPANIADTIELSGKMVAVCNGVAIFLIPISLFIANIFKRKQKKDIQCIAN